MADQASHPADVADEAGDAVATAESRDHAIDARDPIIVAPEAGDGNLLSELARAMHAAATSQYQRLNADLERRRAEQVEAITKRASAETENLKADSETDIGSVDAWAKVETEKIKLERLRRIDARREELAAQLDRQETIKQREVFAIEVAIDAHRNEVDLFFGRMERETDPSAIAQVASTMPPFPSLGDVAERARRGAAAEFASLDGQAAASAEAIASPKTERTASTESDDIEDAVPLVAANGADDESASNLEAAATVSEARLMAVMDPAASRGETETTQPWAAPYAVSVAAGTGPAEEEPAPTSVGSTLLRTVRSIRPMAGRHDKDSSQDGG